MRIALYPDDYLPSSTLVHAKMFHELALELKRLGHEPIVVTPSHNNKQAQRLEIDYIDEIEIWRFRNGPTRGLGKAKRAINETLLSWNAYWAIKDKVKDKPFTACINYSPTIFFGPLMHWFKKRHSTVNYLILRDMFPQWVIDEGLISAKSPIAYYFRFFEKINYRAADCIGLMSEANINLFRQRYPEFTCLRILNNWSALTPLSTIISSASEIRKNLHLADKVIFFYGGNIGHAQDMANLLRLVKSMQPYPKAHFLFIGQGDEVDLVKQTKVVQQLDNLTYLSAVTQSAYKEILTQVDVGLFSLASSHSAHNFPGKLLGYMLAALPILGSVNAGNDLIELINQERAGNVFVNGEDQALFDAAKALLDSSELRCNLGKNANRMLHEQFSVQAAAEHLLQAIQENLTK